MCCNAFWKRVVVFCLTFGFGVFVSGLFISKEISNENIRTMINSIPEKESPLEKTNKTTEPNAKEKNCIPVDGKLQYIPLNATDDNSKVEISPEIKKDKKIKNKENENRLKEMSKELDRISRNLPNLQTLLYKEQCFETQEQK
jgi:hypothetical protein